MGTKKRRKRIIKRRKTIKRQGGNNIDAIIENVLSTKTNVSKWEQSLSSIDLRIMFKNLKKNNENYDPYDVSLFGVDWGNIKEIEYVKRPEKNIYIFKKNETNQLFNTISLDTPEPIEPKKKYTYIKLINGPLFVYIESKNGGHRDIISNLNKSFITLENNRVVKNPIVLFCEVAGELMFDKLGDILHWNCQSGTFQPKCGINKGDNIEPIFTNIDELPKNKYLPGNSFELIDEK
jgi:hypothetical protein